MLIYSRSFILDVNLASSSRYFA